MLLQHTTHKLKMLYRLSWPIPAMRYVQRFFVTNISMLTSQFLAFRHAVNLEFTSNCDLHMWSGVTCSILWRYHTSHQTSNLIDL